jgi:DNA (cytosine-5)-methyltransferase 1
MAMVTKNNKELTVHDAAALLGISADTLRRWHKKGLVKATKGANGERLFDTDEIQRVQNRSEESGGVWSNLKATKSPLTAIELFCGAGGLALGLSNAGIQAKLLVDFDRYAVETLKLNRPQWNSVCASVVDINLDEYRDQIDIMAGGFPCQAFSYAGNKLGFADTRGTLFYEYVRLIKQVNPKVVIGENVKGLTTHDQGRTLKVMVKELEGLGYKVAYKVLRSQFLDVPQKRERLVIMAVRSDLGVEPVFPIEKDYIVSVRTALEGVPPSDGQKYTDDKRKLMELVPPGGYWRDLPVDLQKKYMGASFHLGGGKTGMARRLSWDEPSLTLTCNPAQKQTERCHPQETRPLTVREYARIQCFPDEWVFSGGTSQQYKQIGNAVPVNLGYHIGLAVRAVLGHTPSRADKPAKLAPVASLVEPTLFESDLEG